MFNITHSNLLKIIGIFMMLFHHLFTPGLYFETQSFFPLNQSIVYSLAEGFRLCINIFVFVSGYGIYKSYCKKEIKGFADNVKFVINRIVKLLYNYWWCFLLYLILYILFVGDIQDVYGQGFQSIKYFALDVLGLSYIQITPTINKSWWYLSFIIVITLLFPIIKKAVDISPILTLIVSIVLLRINAPFIPNYEWYFKDYYLMFIYTFIFGMIFAKYKLFDKLNDFNINKLFKVVFLFLLLIAVYYLRGFGLFERTINTYLVIILACIVSLFFHKENKITGLINSVGKHTSNMYYIHYIFCTSSLYSFIAIGKNFIVMLILLFVVCLLISMFIEFIKSKVISCLRRDQNNA